MNFDNKLKTLNGEVGVCSAYENGVCSDTKKSCDCCYSASTESTSLQRVDEKIEIYSLVSKDCTDESISSQILKVIKKILGKEFNPRSVDDVREILYNDSKCPVMLRTRTGAPSVSIRALDLLCYMKREIVSNDIRSDFAINGKTILKADVLNNAKFPVALLLREYRKYVKIEKI